MGGGYYDRDDDYTYNNNPSYSVNASYSGSGSKVVISSGNDYSDKAENLIGKNSQLAFSLDPRRWKDTLLTSDGEDPIVFAIDVTGSMGDWSKVT